jgi:hypothetical protein
MLQIFTHASLCSQIADEAEIRLTGSLEKLRTDYINYLNHFVPLAIETHLIKTGDAKVDVQRGKRLAMALRDMYGWMLDQDIYTLPMLSKMFAQTDEEQRNALALYPTP